ncbi:MAG: endonuclease III [Candidatus Micrarchaeota archaeon]
MAALKRTNPEPRMELEHGNPLELLVSTILSAQCTDARVNMVTAGLFKKYKTASDYAEADQKAFEQEIRSTGFYRNKAKNIIAACKIIDERHGGKVPDTTEGLLELPGVARKTANIVLTAGFGKVEGIAVDTHVMRVSQRLGLTKQKDPNKIERDLMRQIPRRDWGEVNMLMVLFGRYTCTAKRPQCGKCLLNKACPSAFKVKGWE